MPKNSAGKGFPWNTAAIVMMCILVGSHSAGSVLVQTMANHFPDEPMSRIYMFSTITSMMGFWVPMAVGVFIGKRIGYKPVLMVCSLTFLIGGVGPFFFHSSWTEVLIFRAIYGFGNSMTCFRSALISFRYEDTNIRSRMLGYFTTIGMIASICMQLAFGAVAEFNVWCGFLIYLVGAVAALTVAFMEEPFDRKKAGTEAPTPDSEKSGPGQAVSLRIVPYILLQFLVMLMLYTFQLNMSSLVEMRGFGRAFISGVMGSIFTVGTAVSGVVVGRVFTVAKKYAVSVMCGLFLASQLCTIFAFNPFMFAVGGILAGIAFGAGFALVFPYISDLITPDQMALAVGIDTAMGYGGAAFAGIFSTFFIDLFGGGVIGAVYGNGIICLLTMLFCAVVDIRPAKTRRLQENSTMQ